MKLSNFVSGLPKVELHVHVEGTLEPELKFALAKRNGITLAEPTPAQVRQSYNFTDLTSFLQAYYDGMNVLLTEADFYDLALSYLQKAAGQNVRYVEMFFDPQAHTSRGVSIHTVIRGIHRAQVDAEAKWGIVSTLIMCFLRDFQVEYAMATLLESLPYAQWILGVGLDSDENNHPPADFSTVFARARQEGYLLTAHCDVDMPNSIEHINQVVNQIGAYRIDHGTNVVEDPALVRQLADSNIGLTSCPISNSWISQTAKVEEIIQLTSSGVKVSINSDDPAYFGGYIAENYQLLEDSGLDHSFLADRSRDAVAMSWASPTLKRQILDEIDEYCA
ncbi:adenosine deaminase [Actinomyces sp. HMSC064C12]|nr:adenosine deaminase [Actinomyces sp. HMSC064C12]